MKHRLILALLTFLPITHNTIPAHAQTRTITETHTYVMGDNDSRNDARQLCFLEAKRKVLEKAGSFIQSHSVVENMNLTKDQITSYSAAVLSVEIVKEDFGFSKGQNTLALTVKADVDITDVRKRLQAIAEDKGLQGRIASQQQQIRMLEKEVHQLNARVSVAPFSSADDLRKERNIVVGNIHDLENKKLTATQRISKEQDEIKQRSEMIRRYIVRGMNQEEVRQILGEPIRTSRGDPRYGSLYKESGRDDWFYGELSVCFKEPLGYGDLRVWGVRVEGTKEGCRELQDPNR